MSTSAADDTPDSLLARLAGRPAEDDWRRLVGLYQPFVGRWLRQLGVPDADADDLTQDVLTALVRELPAFRHAGRCGSFRRWLRTIAVNRARGFWRSRRAGPQAADPVELDALADPGSGLSGQWDREHDEHVAGRLLRLLEPEFSPAAWAAFRRQVVDGRPAAAVAAELGTTVNAVLIAKSRVLRRFRREAAGLLG